MSGTGQRFPVRVLRCVHYRAPVGATVIDFLVLIALLLIPYLALDDDLYSQTLFLWFLPVGCSSSRGRRVESGPRDSV